MFGHTRGQHHSVLPQSTPENPQTERPSHMEKVGVRLPHPKHQWLFWDIFGKLFTFLPELLVRHLEEAGVRLGIRFLGLLGF